MVFALAAVLAGCAGTGADPNDPFERTNRSVFGFNRKVDSHVLRPVATFYNRNVPDFARDGVHNFVNNTNAPAIFANDVLQGEPTLAAKTLGRFVVNSTLGVGGLVDVAARWNIEQHHADFGQTLGIYGVGGSPYLVLPLLGPSNPRDLAGTVVDAFLTPLAYVKWRSDTFYLAGLGSLGILDARARSVDLVDQIGETSVDPYASFKSLYMQHRQSEIRHGKTDTGDLPDF